MKKLILIIFLLSGCSKKVMVSNSDLQTKMKMESEKARVEMRDKKILLLTIVAVYGYIMYKVANNYKE